MRKKLLIGGIAIVLLFIPLFLWLQSAIKQTSSPSSITPAPTFFIQTTPVVKPKPFKENTFHGILPGVSSQADSIKILGQPVSIAKDDTFTVLSFPTDSQYRQNKIYTQENTVMAILEEVTIDNSLYADYQIKHGKAQETFVDPQTIGTDFVWYVYPLDGVAFLANEANGYTLKRLYFTPVTKETFDASFAKTFSFESPSSPAVESAE
jgi:hypothetical protein